MSFMVLCSWKAQGKNNFLFSIIFIFEFDFPAVLDRFASMSSSRGRDKDKSKSGSHSRDRSPLRNDGEGNSSQSTESFSKEDLMNFMSSAMSAQMPRLILEASKVVSAQLQVENQENSKSFSAFSQEMKQMKLRQQEVVAQAKAAVLKGEGIIS